MLHCSRTCPPSSAAALQPDRHDFCPFYGLRELGTATWLRQDVVDLGRQNAPHTRIFRYAPQHRDVAWLGRGRQIVDRGLLALALVVLPRSALAALLTLPLAACEMGRCSGD